MRLSLLLLLLVTIQCTFAARAADGVPTPCMTIFSAAKSAIANKKAHVPEAKLRAALPARSTIEASATPELAELALSLNEIVDDVYGEYVVEPTTYATYKAEVCERRLAHKVVPATFGSIHSALAACAKKVSPEAIECAMGVAGSKEDNDAA
jgi:hypothetical protein